MRDTGAKGASVRASCAEVLVCNRNSALYFLGICAPQGQVVTIGEVATKCSAKEDGSGPKCVRYPPSLQCMDRAAAVGWTLDFRDGLNFVELGVHGRAVFVTLGQRGWRSIGYARTV